jgi:UDPglucose 6-dehydrogenase
MKLAVIGSGHVGLVTGSCFAEKGYKVLCIDNDITKISSLKRSKLTFYEPGLEELLKSNIKKGRISFSADIKEAVDTCDIIFIAVGTPLGEDGSADLSYIENVSYDIARHLKNYRVIVEKSTVPVKTGERVKNLIKKYAPGKDFDIVSNPEFLQEGKAIQTTLYPDRIVVGLESEKARQVMTKLYSSFKAPLIITDLASAELIKHASNSFLAMKISYVNALARICELSGADISQVAYGIGLDKRIGLEFLKAGIGYGGYCLPKDVAAFAHISEQLGFNFNLLKEIQKINLNQRDWFVKKVEKELWVVKGKKVGLWGLSFKSDTDDIRESPAISICRKLSEKGAIIRAYDPQVSNLRKEKIPNLKLCKTLYEAAKGVHCLVIATDWSEFKSVDFKSIRKNMLHPTIIDGRNMFEPSHMRKMGFTYLSVGRN